MNPAPNIEEPDCINLIYGPVPSRRLGRSIGINTIPFKNCSYACVYCQLGSSIRIQSGRSEFFKPELVVEQLERKLKTLSPSQIPDYLTIVPDGEPTLDIHLGQLINDLKRFDIPVAVISNGSMLSFAEVSDALMQANLVSLKVDSVNAATWKRINHPHRDLNLTDILDAISRFSKSFTGKLVTESMLIHGLNDSSEELTAIADFLKPIQPDRAYLAVPTRPPAWAGIEPASEAALVMAYNVFHSSGINAEYLTDYEGNAFACSGNFTQDILSITAVHPMRHDAVMELLRNSGEDECVLNELMSKSMIRMIRYMDQKFYLRNFATKKRP